MLPERDQRHITLEEIISNAKEIMLREGKHVPVLIVEGGSSLIAGQIPDMPPTHGERMELMHFLGQVAAKSGRIDQLKQVFMVTEGWMSLRVMFTVDDIDETLARLLKRGAQLIGEVVQYEDSYRLCYIRGPEGLLIGLAEQLG